jgi:hypothetical protein
MAIDWIILKSDAGSLDAIAKAPRALGRQTHVKRLISDTFVGTEWFENVGTWRFESVVLEMVIPNDTQVLSIQLSIHFDNISDAMRKVSAGLRKLNRRRGWSVFDVSTSERIAFAPSRATSIQTKPRRLHLRQVNTAAVPRSRAHRRVLYVAISGAEDLSHVLDDFAKAAKALHISRDWAVGEERARLILADGRALQGISFKTAHSSVEETAKQVDRLVLELLPDGTFRSLRGAVPHIAECTAYEY